MDSIVNELKNLSEEELIRLKAEINKHLSIHANNKLVQEAIEEIKQHGYYCTSKIIRNFDGYNKLKLKLYIDIYTHDKEDKSDWHITGDISEEQDPWVDELEFYDYTPMNEDELKWGDWDDPIQSRVPITIYLYYQVRMMPNEGSKCKIITENGSVEELEIINSEIWINGAYFDKVETWENYDFCIISD